MSCGTPAIISKIPSTESLENISVRVPLNAKMFNKQINNFFKFSEKRKRELSKKSRKFIIKEYDDKVWANEYVDKIFN